MKDVFVSRQKLHTIDLFGWWHKVCILWLFFDYVGGVCSSFLLLGVVLGGVWGEGHQDTKNSVPMVRD